MVFRPFNRLNFKNLAIYSSCECLLSRATGNSDSQNAIMVHDNLIAVWAH